ncbi:amino acid permease [Candidatus Woesearchaeota archaeon]|nr:amino acid permease [Candidatus Woesearchaeota archaeon]
MFKKRGVPKRYAGFFRNRVAIATATLMGTIIGAGILGIPYVVAKTGFLYGFIIIGLIGLASMALNLFLGEVVLRTKGHHQLTGYAGKYLGPWGKRITALAMFLGIYGALTAYLIGEGAALFTISGLGSPLFFSILFFLVGSFIVYRGIKTTGRAELILISLLFLMVILIGIFSFNQINLDNLAAHDITKLFVPYGVVLFAFIGFASIPEIREELSSETKKMRKALLIGSIIPILLYIVFAAIVIGMVGLDNFELLQPNERIATIALSIYSQPLLGLFANLLAVLAMFTSFLALGMALLDIYEYDYKLSKNMAMILTFSVPLVIVMFNLTSFISVLEITGIFSGGLNGIAIVLMNWKAKKAGERKPEFSVKWVKLVGVLLIVMFVLGMLYGLWELLGKI